MLCSSHLLRSINCKSSEKQQLKILKCRNWKNTA